MQTLLPDAFYQLLIENVVFSYIFLAFVIIYLLVELYLWFFLKSGRDQTQPAFKSEFIWALVPAIILVSLLFTF